MKIELKTIKCNCGRNQRDIKDLAILKHHATDFHNISNSSWVKCLRPSCKGQWQSSARYVDNLPEYKEAI